MYQTNPVGVMVHADSGMNCADMAGHTWVTQTGQVAPDYIKKTLGIDFDTQVYQGSIANFVADDSLVQQGWPTNEVYQAQAQGVDTKFFSYAESGYNPYNDVIFATKDYIAKNPDVIKAFLDASMHGWSDYISDIDVATATNAALVGQFRTERAVGVVRVGQAARIHHRRGWCCPARRHDQRPLDHPREPDVRPRCTHRQARP